MDDTITTRRSIDDIATQATTDPTKLAPAEITRLGDWILDHEAHVLAHGRLVAATGNRDITAERRAARGQQLNADTELTRRLAPSDPAKQPVDGDTTEHTA